MLDTAAARRAQPRRSGAREELRELTEERPGKDWDEDYMEAMVEGHERVLKHLQDAIKAANAGELRTALEADAAKVQAHLNKAREIKDKIG